MSCHDEHAHGGAHGEEHSHSHSHVKENEGAGIFLLNKIDVENVTILNGQAGTKASSIIKPLSEGKMETTYLESDADDQLIVRIPFTGNVKLRSLLMKAGPQGYTPSLIKVFANKDDIGFDEAEETQSSQEFDVPVSRDVVEYSVRPAKFPAVHSLTIYIPGSQGADTTRLYFLGFRGEYTDFTRDPVISVYESKANPADHPKIPGLDGATSRLG